MGAVLSLALLGVVMAEPGYGRGYYGGYGHGHGLSYGYGHGYHGYGKRSADAEAEPTAVAQPGYRYGGYGHGGYGHIGYGGYGGYRGYGKRSADAEASHGFGYGVMAMEAMEAMVIDMARGLLRLPLDTTDIMDITDTTDTMAMDMDMDIMVRKERYQTGFPLCLTPRIQ